MNTLCKFDPPKFSLAGACTGVLIANRFHERLKFPVPASRRFLAMPMPEFKQLVDEVKKEIKEINCAELERMQHTGDDPAIIDIREPDESARGMIPGAVNIPRGILELHIDEVTSEKDKKIVCYCGGGSRSALAAYMLKRMGFTNAMSLIGGYKGWKAAATNHAPRT